MHYSTYIFQLVSLGLGGSALDTPYQEWVKVLASVVGAVAAGVSVAYIIQVMVFQYRNTKQRRERIEQLEQKTEKEPEKVKFAWELARERLERYFDGNLSQVKAIFWVAVLVMVAGFGFVVWGLGEAITAPERVKVAWIGAASGIIMQFIGVTFMVIYRSTMLQATQFMSVLDRINSVGMAVQILDAMNERAAELKDVTRVDIIRLLLAPASAELSFSPRSRKKKSEEQPDKNEAAKP